ncbi:hypothetical protein K7X08_027767 [Anisodus acutangulus]|uniref:Uncharacterized protein n=1 Tax=Anisodus acutangulus TaxID=402998 RepID=A0A9Q1LJH9_9SOLA|nr:hypothetical protein K7X08_027767 [Anisodus acutangulus]
MKNSSTATHKSSRTKGKVSRKTDLISPLIMWSLEFKSNLLYKMDGEEANCIVVNEDSFSRYGTPGVTGSVMWDSGVVLGKFLEHAVESGRIHLQGKKVVELGSGCGLAGCIAALLGAQVILTDLPDRLRLLKKNVEANLYGDLRGSATVNELTCSWLRCDIYSEGAVMDLIATLLDLSGTQTTVILAGELRNDAILEYFLQAAAEDFTIGRYKKQWHPDCCSPRVAIASLVSLFQGRFAFITESPYVLRFASSLRDLGK